MFFNERDYIRGEHWSGPPVIQIGWLVKYLFKKLSSLFLLLIFLNSVAISQSIDTPIMAGSNSLPSTSTVNYSHPFGNLLTWNVTENNQRSVIAVDGTSSNFYANVATAPGAGTSWAFTLVKNGVDTAITCTIADAATSCSDLVNTVALAPGDTYSVKSAPTGTPAAPVQIYFGWVFSSTATNESILLGANRSTGLPTASVQYGAFSGASTPNSTLNLRDSVIPTDGTASDLYVELNSAPGTGGDAHQIRLLKNGVATGLTCTITDSATTCNDTLNSVSFVVGDLVAMEFTPSGPSPNASFARWSMKWVSDTVGESILSYSSGSNLNNGGSVRYAPPGGTSNTWQSVEDNVQVLVPGTFWLKDFTTVLNDVPGVAASYTFNTRINSDDGSITTTLSDSDTNESDLVNFDNLIAGDKLAISSLSSGFANVTQAKWGIVVGDSAVLPPPPSSPTPTPTPVVSPTPTPTPGSVLLKTPIMAGGKTVPPTNSTNYSPPFGNLLYWGATENNQRGVIATFGNASDFHVDLPVAPGAGKSWVFTLVKNGVDTGLTCTIADTAQLCSDTSTVVNLLPGDTVSIKAVPSGLPTPLPQIFFGWIFESIVDNESVLLGTNRNATLSPTTVQYGVISGASSPNASLELRESVIPADGIISNLYVELNIAPSSGDAYQFTLIKNGSPTSLTCTISGSATTCNDVANNIIFAPGDTAAIEFTPSGSAPTSPFARWSMKWVSDNDGESILSYSSGGNMNTSGVVRYAPPGGTSNTWQSIDANGQVLVPGSFWFKDFTAELTTPPGAGATYTFNTRVNAVGTGITTVIAGSDTTGSNLVTNRSAVAGDKLTITSKSSGIVNVSQAKWGLVVVDTAIEAVPIPTPLPSPSPYPTPTTGPTINYACTKVTNTNNSGPGSLRECLESPNSNLCVFEISGRIALLKDIRVKANKILACQTAPASGAMITNGGLFIEGSNVRVEHCELRAGDEEVGTNFDQRRSVTVYAQSGGNIVENVLIKNNSMSWSIDQQVSTGQAASSITRNVTFLRNFIYEGLWRSYHSDFTHSTNVLIGKTSGATSLIGNLFANSRDRNPMIKAGAIVEIINNYIYNYGPTQKSNLPRLEYSASAPTTVDFIGNKCVNGPRSTGTPYCLYNQPAHPDTLVYMADNRGPTRTSDVQPETDIAFNNSTGIAEIRVVNRTTSGILDVDDIYADVVANAGARPWARLDVDQRMLTQVASGGTLGAHYDCVTTSRCDVLEEDLQVPEGGFPVRPVEARGIVCDPTYTESAYETWVAQFETTDPPPDTTPIPSPTVTASPVVSPSPSATVPPVGRWYDRFIYRK